MTKPRHLLPTGFLLIISSLPVYAQQVDLGNIKNNITQNKPVKVGGGISANNVFYNGNDGQGRQPYTYFLNGNINFNIYNQVNLPFTFSLTNLGNNFSYPTLPNRLSLHPMYKWIQGHIGDVAMSFSPYTLNAHMFRGVGVDLAPEGKWKFSAMGGRLQKEVEYNPENPVIQAAYHRMGYGAKVRYDDEEYYLGMSFLSAKDNLASLNWIPDSLGIFPKSNVAMSWEGGVRLLENLHISGEYAVSLLTRDIRALREGSSFIDKTFGNRTSTQAYKAIRTDINYKLTKNNIGIGYEKIDPDYATLGAYYFNNDYENITLNYARPLLHDKVNIAISWGVQRDDLHNTQEQSSKRFVSSGNLDYTPNDKFMASLSYSSFQTYMNIRSQFDYINGQTPYDNLDTLDFTQLSQNMALNTMYNLGMTEARQHNLNMSLSFQEAADKQGDIIRPGNLSQFYNLSAGYNLLLVPQAVSFQAAFNTTYNLLGGENFITLGPTVGVKAKVFQRKATTGISSSYNVSRNEGAVEGKVLNIRWNAGYSFLKKHNLNANAIWQKRDVIIKGVRESLTATIAYSYSF